MFAFRLRRTKRVSDQSRRLPPQVRRLFLQALEERAVLAAVSWINPAGGAWDVASNWSSGAVPTSADDVTIDTASPITIAIHLGDNISINSITTGASDTLSFSGGSLTVSAASTLDGPLAMNGGALAASGAGASLTANGDTTISGANLYAAGGGSLILPQLTSYAANNSTFSADGAGSALDVSALATLTDPVGGWSVIANHGGEVNLSSLTELRNQNGRPTSITFTDTEHSTILDGKLASLDGFAAALDGTDAHVADSWAKFANGTLNILGGNYTLPGLTDIDGSDLNVSGGGVLSLPGLTAYTPSGNYFQASTPGAVLDVSALKSVTPAPSGWRIRAVDSGAINLAALTSLSGANQNISITDTNGGKLLDGNLTALSNVYVSLDGSDPHVADSWTKLVNGRLTVSGGVYTLLNLIDVDDSDLGASNSGRLALPGVTSYAAGGNFFSAQGAGSVLDVSAVSVVTNSATQQPGLFLTIDDGGELKLNGLTTLVGAHIQEIGNSQLLDAKLTTLDNVSVNFDGSDPNIGNSWQTFTGGVLLASGGSASFPALTDIDGSNFYVFGGAKVSAPMVTSYAAGQTISVTGAGSVLDLSGLILVTQKQAALNITVSTGGELKLTNLASLKGASHGISIVDNGHSSVLDSNLAQLAGVDVSLDGSDPHVADAWTELTNGKLDITGGGFTLPRLIDIDGSSLSVSAGGALSLPGLTSYASQGTFQASGNGVLDLPALASVTQQQGDWSVSAVSGGQVNLSGLTRLSGHGAGLFSVSFSGGGTILDGSLTTLDHVNITLDGLYPHLADSWIAFTNGSLTVSGGSYSLSNLKDADGSSLSAMDGGSLELPGLTAYAAPSGPFAIRVSGTGSVLDLRALAALTCPVSSGISAVSGGQLNLSGLTSLDGGPNSLQIWETGNAKILDPNLTSLNRVQLLLDGTDPQIANSWTKLTSGALTLMGGVYDLPNLVDIDQSGLDVLYGGSLTLPGVTSYATNGSFSADGQGSVLDLPALNALSQQSFWDISAAHGGEIKLTGLTSLNSAAPGAISITDTGDSRIVTGNLTALDQVAVTFDGTDPQMADAWSSFVNGKVTLNGGAYDFSHLIDVGGSSLNALGGGVLTLSSLANAENLALLAKGAGSAIELPNLATFTGPNSSVTVGDGGSIALGAQTVAMPSAGTGLTIDVPQLPFNVPINLSSTGSFNGATFNLGQGDVVNVADGTFTGITTFNVGRQATLDLTGGNLVDYTGTLVGSGLGAVQLASGGVRVGAEGLSLDFPSEMFQWTGGSFYTSAGDLTNQGVINLVGSADKSLYGAGTLDVFGTIEQTGSGNLVLQGDNGKSATLKIEQGGSYLLESDSGIGDASGGPAAIVNYGTISKTSPGASTLAIDSLSSNGDSLYFAKGVGGDFYNAGVVALGAGSTLIINGNFMQASMHAGTLDEQIGGNPASGQFGRLVVDRYVDLTGALNVTLVNGFSPSNGQDYKVLTFAGRFGNFSTTSGVASHFTLQSNAGSIDLIAAAPTAHEKYVTAVYQDVLGRAPDDAGLASWTKLLDGGAPIGGVAAAIVHSDEYFANFVIRPDYLKLLGRAADDAGVKYWTAQMQAGLTDQQLEAQLVASDEFYAKAGENFDAKSDADDASISGPDDHNADWVDAVYKLLLGRSADSAGEKYWGEELAAGASRTEVALSIANSAENEAHLIDADYQHYLGRAADAAGLAFWLEQFAHGQTNEDLIAGFTGSDEYYQQHTS